MITREQVAELRAGDVVEISNGRWLVGTALRGPLSTQGKGALFLADVMIRSDDGRPNVWDDLYLTVVSRAPRPLYVNHDRAEPVPGDVVRDADDADSPLTWAAWQDGRHDGWISTRSGISADRKSLPDRLRLLIDGATGEVVP